jgi:Na+/H+-dicarboxylate symporter
MTALAMETRRTTAWWKEFWVQVLIAMVIGIALGIGNAVATIVVAKWENALDERRMQRVLNGEALPAAVV